MPPAKTQDGVCSGQSAIAFETVQSFAQFGPPALLGRRPWPFDEGRTMADVLLMAAFELGNPMALFVLMEADDGPKHRFRSLLLSQRDSSVSLTKEIAPTHEAHR